jgi:hypothetical protein
LEFQKGKRATKGIRVLKVIRGILEHEALRDLKVPRGRGLVRLGQRRSMERIP